MFKLYFWKLKKQQCIRRSPSRWAQRDDTQIVWHNSFWDMTKCLKPYFCKLKKRSVFAAALPAEHNALTLRSTGPIVSGIWQNVWKLVFANWRSNSVFGVGLPAEHNALTLRSIGPIVSEIWQNVQNLIFENWRNNSVFGTAPAAEHNAMILRSIAPILSEIWQNV
jgi:hypothetical protein